VALLGAALPVLQDGAPDALRDSPPAASTPTTRAPPAPVMAAHLLADLGLADPDPTPSPQDATLQEAHR
jgi:hypothetical protein